MSPRRRLFTFLALLLLLILGWLGLEQYQLIQRQAAAPVVSVAEDGTVRINGVEIVIGADGLPPKVLELFGGGPPVDCHPPKALSAEVLGQHRQARQWSRRWYYPRTGLEVWIQRRVERGAVEYRFRLLAGRGSSNLPCTLEFRGQRWWLGHPGPLGAPVPRDLSSVLGPGVHETEMMTRWETALGGGMMEVCCVRDGLLGRLHSRLAGEPQLHSVLVLTPWSCVGTVAVKDAAFAAGDASRGW